MEIDESLMNEEQLVIDINKTPEAAPKAGKMFGQDVEAKGTYVSSGHTPIEGYVNGKANLRKPLIVNIDNNTMIQYKYDLAEKFKAKGKRLTNKLMRMGYDAIVTQYADGNYGEIVLLPNAQFAMG